MSGSGAPTYTTRSAGTKIVLYPSLTAAKVDVGFGVDAANLWSSVSALGNQFKWYAATTNIATLFGTGELVLGTTTLTGIASQPLQVTGGAYVSGNTGIGTTNPQTKLEINGVLGFGINNNIKIGTENTGFSITSGSQNTYIGIYAGYANTDGSYNTFIGPSAGSQGTTGSFNNYFGYESGNYSTGNFNNFFGYGSGFGNIQGSNNLFLGNYIGQDTTASYKILIGSGYYPNIFDAPDSNKSKQFAVGLNTTGTSQYWLVGNENFNVGIGTTNPQTKLEINGVL